MKLRSLFVISDKSQDGIVDTKELESILSFGFKLCLHEDEAFVKNGYKLTDEQLEKVKESTKAIMDTVDKDNVCFHFQYSLFFLFIILTWFFTGRNFGNEGNR